MSYRDQVIARFGLRVVVPAVAVLIGALAIVIISLSEMADEVNRIEDQTDDAVGRGRAAGDGPRLEETPRDYAEWDDAVRNLYGDVNQAFMDETFTISTIDPVFFDTAILLDEVGGVRFAVHKGEPLQRLALGDLRPARFRR